MVSIHALLAECDLFLPFWIPAFPGFNPRTPCGVRRRRSSHPAHHPRFQSTHSLRSATGTAISFGSIRSFQSTHSLRSATGHEQFADSDCEVSIHALLAECDQPETINQTTTERFQSTHSLRSATGTFMQSGIWIPVSIHALLAECDRTMHGQTLATGSFNPRTPCGVRRP